jgi:hypothetical protein
MIRGGERDRNQPDPERSEPAAAPEDAAEAAAQLRRQREALKRRLDEIFGPRLPEQQTTDDQVDPADRRPAANGDDWLLRQVPPHHG